MSDEFINKYRPKALKEVIGQPAVVRSFEGALDKNRSRFFLFSGPSGTGKTTLARLGAIKAGCAARDILDCDAATNTGIDDMRKVTEGLAYLPIGESKTKAVIVDEAQALSKAAVTSLLKVTEEPPPHVIWFLCTTEPARIPAALITRATHYSLKPVGFDDLVGLLDKVVGAEGLDLDEAIIDLCAKEAGGSPRQALANLSACAEAEDINEAKDLLRSAIDSAEAVALARALVNGASWSEVQKILVGLKEIAPESIRHVVRAYVTNVVLGAKKEGTAGRGLEILDAFSTPFHPADGISPVVLAAGKAVLG